MSLFQASNGYPGTVHHSTGGRAEILGDDAANCIEHAIASGDKREKVNELISVLSNP